MASYAECSKADAGGCLGAHTARFVISVGSYVVIAVGAMNFDGWIMVVCLSFPPPLLNDNLIEVFSTLLSLHMFLTSPKLYKQIEYFLNFFYMLHSSTRFYWSVDIKALKNMLVTCTTIESELQPTSSLINIVISMRRSFQISILA